ncbi:hypothetical protein ABIA16_003536 [Sinorhizobium fredii]
MNKPIDLTDLAPSELEDLQRRFEKNLGYFRITEEQAAIQGGGQIYRVAMGNALHAVRESRNRRMRVGSMR